MLRGRHLGIIYNDKQSSFNELLNKDSAVSIYVRKGSIILELQNRVTKPIYARYRSLSDNNQLLIAHIM